MVKAEGKPSAEMTCVLAEAPSRGMGQGFKRHSQDRPVASLLVTSGALSMWGLSEISAEGAPAGVHTTPETGGVPDLCSDWPV